jgi:hypothetical protein
MNSKTIEKLQAQFRMIADTFGELMPEANAIRAANGSQNLTGSASDELNERIMTSGLGNRAIAKQVGVSAQTVKTHRAKLQPWVDAKAADKLLLQGGDIDEMAAKLGAATNTLILHACYRTGQEIFGKRRQYIQKNIQYRVETNGRYIKMFPLSA